MKVKHYCEVVYTDVRPQNYNTHDFNKGDCTTRALTYMAMGRMTYEEIEKEQYRLARDMSTGYHTYHRNSNGVWDKIAKRWGYSWVHIKTPKARTIVTAMLHSIENPIGTLSRTHIAIAHRGKIHDTWDSSGGRIFGLLVHNDDIAEVVHILGFRGVSCEVVPNIQHKVNRHRSRSYYW